MNSSSPGDDSKGESAAALEEWVAETATRKSISERELLDEVLSSYWILEELSEIVGTADSGGVDGHPPRNQPEPGSGEDHTSESDKRNSEDSLSELESELQHLREAIEEAAILESDEVDGGDRVRETSHQSDPETTPAGTDFEWVRSSDTGPTRRKTSTSRDEFEPQSISSSSHPDSGPSRHGSGIDVETTLEGLETDFRELFDLVAEISTELDSVLGRGEQCRECSGTDTSIPAIERRLEKTRQDHHEFEREIEREFDSIENVLEHLLRSTENLSYRVDAAVDSLQDDVATIRERLTERDSLASLKSEANRAGVESAVCNHCEQSVTITLLEEPRCPVCECGFTGLEPGGWLPFQSATLQTRPFQSDPGPNERVETMESDVERFDSDVDSRH